MSLLSFISIIFFIIPPKNVLYYFVIIVNIFIQYFTKISGQIAHNVPAVYDVLAARIRALRSKDQGRQNVGEVSRGNEA
jgi:hypothetical protein